jgi:hypothetical protein
MGKGARGWVPWATCSLVAALTAGALVVYLLPGQPQRLQDRLPAWSFTAVAVPFALVGALIVVRRPGNRLGGVLLVGAISINLEKIAQELVQYGVHHPGAVRGLVWIGWISNWAWVPSILMVLLVLLLFPDGQPLSPRWRPLVWITVAGALITMVAAALLPGIADTALLNPLGLAGRTGAMLEEQLQMLVTFGLPLVTVAASASLIVRFRQARGVQRQQLKWLAYAAGMVILTLVIQDSWLGGWGDAVSNLALWAVPAAIGVAILRHRLYDVDRLINRTLVYGVLTALLGGVYIGTVLVLGQVFGGVGKDPPSWAVAGATLAVAALFQPARRRIQAVVDRRFNRRKYDAVRTVEAFSVRMRDEVDLDALSAELLAVVEQTIQPTRASLWLRPAPQAPPRGHWSES